MRSFVDIGGTLGAQPPRVGVLLGRVDVAKGREQVHHQHAPEVLSSLATETRIASIRASTAIEGYVVSEDRARDLSLDPPARVRNRNEREFAGYRDAIDGLLRATAPERISLPFVLHLHRQLFAHSGGRGGHLKTDDNQIVRYRSDGRRELIFAPPRWQDTEFLLTELLVRYEAAREHEAAHPIVLIGAFCLDFLAIHPVADGNGRLVRLLTTHELLRAGYGIARYSSLEGAILETRDAYYAALAASQRGWADAAHDPWPWIEYLAEIVGRAYDALEERIAGIGSTRRTSKQDLVRGHVARLPAGTTFRFRDLRATFPQISDQTLRLALDRVRDDQLAVVSGRGAGARWTRSGPVTPITP